MFSGREKTFACLILLLAASAASAFPTIVSDSPSHIESDTSEYAAGVVSGDFISNMVLGKVFSQMPLLEGPTAAATGNNCRLPAVPPSIGMVLTGFLCVSLFRDRKTWLALLAGLFAIGQTGINSLPALTLRLTRKVHNARLVEPQFPAVYQPAENFFPDSYNNETQYTGLLHHLAGIPRDTGVFSHITIILVRLASGNLSNCSVSRAEQFVCFSPAFIFNLIPRGPPMPA